MRCDSCRRARTASAQSRSLKGRRRRYHGNARSRHHAGATLMFNGRRWGHDSRGAGSESPRPRTQTGSQPLSRQLRRRRDHLTCRAETSKRPPRSLHCWRRLDYARTRSPQASPAAHRWQIGRRRNGRLRQSTKLISAPIHIRRRGNRRIQALQSGLRARRRRQRYRGQRRIRRLPLHRM